MFAGRGVGYPIGMVTHVVLFKMKDRSGESARRAKEALLGMRGKIPGLRPRLMTNVRQRRAVR